MQGWWNLAITDGSPAGEPKEEIFNVILRADAELKRSRYGADAVSYRESHTNLIVTC